MANDEDKKEGNKVGKVVNNFLMGAVIGGAIGSVIGMTMRAKKNQKEEAVAQNPLEPETATDETFTPDASGAKTPGAGADLQTPIGKKRGFFKKLFRIGRDKKTAVNETPTTKKEPVAGKSSPVNKVSPRAINFSSEDFKKIPHE
jgi:gas vesicle protein